MKKKPENWMQTNWRPVMAIAYTAIILFDFIVAPIFWSLLQAYFAGSVVVQWQPLTLLSGGVFHAAMGAVLGISAFSRGKEKIEQMRLLLDENTKEEEPK